MNCDHLGCKTPPVAAPRIWILSATPLIPDHHPVKMMTTLHFCELHKTDIVADDLLTPKIKRDYETVARSARPLGFKCDFEKTVLEWVDLDSPEYRRFLGSLGADRIMALALA